MIQKTVMITIWWQNRDDYDMMTVQGWGLTPGRAPATRPPLPPTLSATRPAQIVFLHSCSSVFVTSTNCISSLMLKCICVLAPSVFLLSWSSAFVQQRKLYCFTHVMLRCIIVPPQVLFFLLMFKCICNQHKLHFLTLAQVYLTQAQIESLLSWWSAFVWQRKLYFLFMMKCICVTAQNVIFTHTQVYLWTSVNYISSLMLKFCAQVWIIFLHSWWNAQ